jgi:hypothetical protein
LSSCEIEYMILSKTAKKAIWIREFLRELEFQSRNDQLVLFSQIIRVSLISSSIRYITKEQST